MAESCPDENELLDLVAGKRGSPDVARHVANCPTCSLVLADAAPEAPELAPDSTVGRYRIVGEIGRGGVGTVYEARDELLDREVAIKVLRRSSPDAHARLLREARLIARLAHRNVVAIHDAGETSGVLYFAMERVHGQSLRDLAASGAPRARLLRSMIDAGRGLAAAHAAGIVHRDFKPANVLVDDSGRAIVVDFGLAAIDDPGPGAPDALVDDRLTQTGQVFGTPAYMAPEQIAGAAIDARSDQFAFCASLFHVLTGVLPFPGATLAELRASIERGAIDATALARLPRRVRAVVARGLSADRDRRYPSMSAVLAALEGRSRVIIAAAAAAVVVGGAVAAGYLAHGASTAAVDPCVAASARIDEEWSAESVVDPSARASLDAWVASWRADREATCRRAPRAGVDPQIDRAGLCLDAMLVDLGATLEVADAVDASSRARAIAALPRIEGCHAAKPPALSSKPRTERARKLRERLAFLATLGDVRMTMLAGSTGAGLRRYALALPDAQVRELAPVPYAGDLWELVVADEREAYAFDRKQDVLVVIDRTSGAIVRTVKVAGDIHHNGRALARSPSGELVGLLQGRTLAAIDPTTGAVTPKAQLAAEYQLETMAFCPDGTLFAAASDGPGNAAGRLLVTIDPATGRVTRIGRIGTDAIDIDTMTCARDGRLFGLDTIDQPTNDLYAIDPRTGARTLLAVIPGPVNGMIVE